MLDYLLKSGGCLLVLYLFYLLFLEKENMHVYKRVYLLLIIIVSFTIPLATFTNYVEVVEQVQPIVIPNVVAELPVITATEQQNYLPIVLWSLYGLGAVLFGLKFIKNSCEIVKKIKNNPKEKSGKTISVLLNEDVVPHTFFKFIFFNKKKFRAHQIPKEVILHEETHARQKHSVDVLLLEILQVIFWFNPVLFLLNKSIKLNHEFLADQAVLNNGTNTKRYQQTLLAYSSNSSQLPLAHAINYSSIKKRFIVMKTHTSKKKIWICSFILLPLFAILLYSFSTKETIHLNEETNDVISIQNQEQPGIYNDTIKRNYYKNVIFKLKDENKKIIATKAYNELTKEEVGKLSFPINIPQKKIPSRIQFKEWEDGKKFGVWFDGKRVSNMSLKNYNQFNISLYSVSRLEKNAKKYGEYYYQVNLISNKKYNTLYKNGRQPLAKGVVITINESQKKATPKQVAEYNALAKHYNEQPENNRVIKLVEINRLKILYDLMSLNQKGKAEKFPNIPPPPPPSKQRNLERITAQFYEHKNDKGEDVKVELQYDEHKDFYETPPPPPIPENAIEKQRKAYVKITEEYKQKVAVEKKILDEFEEEYKGTTSGLELVKLKAKHGAKFYFDKVAITSSKAISIVEKNNKINLLFNKSIVHLSTDPTGSKGRERIIAKINGNSCDKCTIELSKKELAQMILSVDDGDVLEFKMKFAKSPTQHIKGATLTSLAKIMVVKADFGSMVQIFNLKSTASDLVSPPIYVKIK